MIFITLGSRDYQFNRLLKEIDSLIEKRLITERVVAQIGQSDYIPKSYEYERFMSPERFSEFQDLAEIVVTHGGTGAIISALKKNKHVVAVPRLAKFNEHSDDHQLEITRMLEKLGYILSVEDISKLHENIKKIKVHNCKIYNRESNILEIILNYIDKVTESKLNRNI